MIRRSPLRLAATLVACAAALSACGASTDTDVVARVGGEDIGNDDFESLAEEFFANPDVFGTTPAANGRADGEQSRSLLGAMIRERIVDQFLDREGIDASDTKQAFIDSALADSPVGALSDDIQNLIATIDETPRSEAVALADAPDIDELRAIYADDPAKTGTLCMRHVLVDDEAAAEQVLADLSDGADFATLARERSIEPTAVDTGGALRSSDNECIPLQTVLASFDPTFTAGALEAREGVPSEPVESSFGWHVILHRPWGEVSEAVGELHQPGNSGVLLFDGFAVTTEVETDPRFGTWDPIASIITPIG